MKLQSSTIPAVESAPEKWYLIDADGLVVGRLASRVASIVRGKRTAEYTPHLNPRIHVVIVNADKVVFTGNKLRDKTYYHHSGWRTGIKSTTAGKLLAAKPEEVLRKAIHGMLPKNRLGSVLNKNIRIYAGPDHEQHAQTPEKLEITTRKPLPKD